jgi:hypothetical protein
MTIHYEDTGRARDDRSAFPPAVRLSSGESEILFSVLDRVARSVGHSDRGEATAIRIARAGAAFRLRLCSAAPTEVEAVLDLAAELVESADELLAFGHDLEALALEGITGRLTELLVGAGPCEGAPLGSWR